MRFCFCARVQCVISRNDLWGSRASGEGTVWWRWKWVQGVCGAAVRGVLGPVAASGAGGRHVRASVTSRIRARGSVYLHMCSYIYQMHERSEHTICHDHLCFYRFINTGGAGTHTGHMDTRITQTNLTTILHAHARPRRGRSPTPLSRPNPTANSEEAAPSEPAAPGTRLPPTIVSDRPVAA